MNLFLSPHNDDAVLFGAFTIQREKPLVITVFDSYLQGLRGYYNCIDRRDEDINAMRIIEAPLTFFGFSDAMKPEDEIRKAFREYAHAEMVWAPAIEEGGHAQHNLIGRLAGEIFPRVTYYTTYTNAGKSRGSIEVIPESGEHIRRKLKALACYESQIDIEALGCRPHFMNDLREYYV